MRVIRANSCQAPEGAVRMAKTVQLREPGSAGGGYPESAGNVSASCRECKKPAIRARLIMTYKYKQGPGCTKGVPGLIFLWMFVQTFVQTSNIK